MNLLVISGQKVQKNTPQLSNDFKSHIQNFYNVWEEEIR